MSTLYDNCNNHHRRLGQWSITRILLLGLWFQRCSEQLQFHAVWMYYTTVVVLIVTNIRTTVCNAQQQQQLQHHPLRGVGVYNHPPPSPRWNVGGGLGNGQVSLPKFHLKRLPPPMSNVAVQEARLDSIVTDVVGADTLTRRFTVFSPFSQYYIPTLFLFFILMLLLLLLFWILYGKWIQVSLQSFILQWYPQVWTRPLPNKATLPRMTPSSNSRITRRFKVPGPNKSLFSNHKSVLPTRIIRPAEPVVQFLKKKDKEDDGTSINTLEEDDDDTLQQLEMQPLYHTDTLVHHDSSSARLRKHHHHHRRESSSSSTGFTTHSTMGTTTAMEEYTPVSISNYSKSSSSPQHSRNVLYSSPLHHPLPPLPPMPSPPRVSTPYSAIHQSSHETLDKNSDYPTLPSFYTPPPSPTRPRDTKTTTTTCSMSPPRYSLIESKPKQSLGSNLNPLDVYDPTPTAASHIQCHVSRHRKRIDPSMIQLPQWESSTIQEEEVDTKDYNHPLTHVPSHHSPSHSGIIHKRKNLVMDGSSDASSSLSTLISFTELQFHSIVGGGGFGQVWSASWKGTPVAVKRISPTWIVSIEESQSPQNHHRKRDLHRSTSSWNQNQILEFCAEINLLSGMRHPNICLYMGACLEYPNLAIVTELAAHGSVWDALRLPLQHESSFRAMDESSAWPVALYGSEKDLLKTIPQGTWPWSLIKRVAHGAARGMNYLHSGAPPILHRDLKSANLLLDECYNSKIADFGFSRLKAQQQQSMTGNCGTVQWMAPEILSNQPYAESADVYSYGIILWELLTKECPFEGMSAIQCALAVVNTDARPVIPQWCPDCLASLIQSCMHKNPSSRPTFGQIIQAFDSMP